MFEGSREPVAARGLLRTAAVRRRGDVGDGLLVEALRLLVLEPGRPGPLARAVLALKEGLEEVEGYGQDDRGVLVDGDLAHRLEEPELQRRRALEAVCGLPEALRGLVLALGGDDLGSTLALALCLPGHRPLHLLRYLHVLDLDDADLDAPRVGLLVDDVL